MCMGVRQLEWSSYWIPTLYPFVCLCLKVHIHLKAKSPRAAMYLLHGGVLIKRIGHVEVQRSILFFPPLPIERTYACSAELSMHVHGEDGRNSSGVWRCMATFRHHQFAIYTSMVWGTPGTCLTHDYSLFLDILDTLFFCLSFWLVKFSFHILVYYIPFSLPVSHSLYLCMIYLFHSFTKVPYSFFWTKILKDQKSWSKLHEDLQGLCVKIHWSFNLSCRWHFLI